MSTAPMLMSLNEAAKITSLSRTAIFNLRQRGDFPRAVNLSEKRVAFVRDEVNGWVASRIANRDAESAR